MDNKKIENNSVKKELYETYGALGPLSCETKK
jgi:hypothetical protein